MTTLILAHSFPKDDSDYRGRFIVDYMRSLPNERFVVIAPHPEATFVRHLDNADIHYFHWKHRLLGGMKMYNPLHHLILLKMIVLFYFSAKKAVKQDDIGTVFACWAIPGGIVAWLIRFFHGVHYSVWLLGTDVNKFIKVPLLLKTICNRADAVYANSDMLKRKIGTITDKQVTILPTRSTLPPARKPRQPIPMSDRTIHVAFVGRLEYIKGFDTFVAIAEKVVSKRQNMTFYVFGDGTLRPMAKQADRDGVLVYGGEVSGEELSYYADFIDILLIVSRHESMPVVFWEFQNRADILSFPVGDIPRYLDKQYIFDTPENMIEFLLLQAEKNPRKQ